MGRGNRRKLRPKKRSQNHRSPHQHSQSPSNRTIERIGRFPRRSKSPIVFNEDHRSGNCSQSILYDTNTDFHQYSPHGRENSYSPPIQNNQDYGNITMIRSELKFERVPRRDSFEEAQPIELSSRPESQQLNQEERWRSNHTQQMFISSEELHPDIPEFGLDNSLSSKKWFKIFDTVANKEQWNTEKKKMQMASKLVGPPKEWLLSAGRLMENWRNLKICFLKMFKDDMDYFQQLQHMLAKVKAPNESYSNYFTFKTSLLKSCDITGRKAVSCLIGGIDNEALKPVLYDHSFDTPELLFKFLVEHEKTSIGPHTNMHSGPEIIGLTPIIAGPPSLPVEERTDVVKVIINGVILQAYNDPKSIHVTIKEYQAKLAKLQHNKYRRVIQGYQGSLFTVLGDTHTVIRVGSATVNIQVFVVQESFQHFPVIIGDTLRQDPSIVFYKDQKGIHFFQKDTAPKDNNSSFAINQRLVEKMNAISKNVPQASILHNIPSLMPPKVGVPNLGINQFGIGGEAKTKKRPRHRRR